jgi:excisionase family DNA binding protein
MLLTPRKAAKHFNVSKQTLRRWATAGKVDYIRTEKGHMRYRIEGEIDRKNYIYARVSSSKQKVKKE